MTAAIDFHRLAMAEYLAARNWYRQRSPISATRFEAAVADAVARIAANPGTGSPFAGPCRWVRTKTFPYTIHYEETGPNRVVVYAFAHGRRKSNYWLKRRRRP